MWSGHTVTWFDQLNSRTVCSKLNNEHYVVGNLFNVHLDIWLQKWALIFRPNFRVQCSYCGQSQTYLLLNRYWRRTLGLQVRYADCGGYRFCYSCRGKPGMRPSILMLHGFSAHKDSWLTVVKVRVTLNITVFCSEVVGISLHWRHLKIYFTWWIKQTATPNEYKYCSVDVGLSGQNSFFLTQCTVS